MHISVLGNAMLVTSFTTSVAFFSTAVFPIMPISTLGVWAGLLVIMQFLLTITVYPCAIIIWHRFWKDREWWNTFKRPGSIMENETNEEVKKEKCSSGLLRRRNRSEKDYRLIEKFFNGLWTRFIYKARWSLFATSIGIIGISVFLANKLESPLEPEQYFPKSNELRKARTVVRKSFEFNVFFSLLSFV